MLNDQSAPNRIDFDNYLQLTRSLLDIELGDFLLHRAEMEEGSERDETIRKAYFYYVGADLGAFYLYRDIKIEFSEIVSRAQHTLEEFCKKFKQTCTKYRESAEFTMQRYERDNEQH